MSTMKWGFLTDENDDYIIDEYTRFIVTYGKEDVMSALIWDAIGEHFYEIGVDHGVLYQVNSTTGKYENGVAWNGLTQVTEKPSGAEAQKKWADNLNYLTLYTAEQFDATVEAFTYPDEFEQNDGSATLITGVTIGQQPRKPFGMAYRTKMGNDVAGDALGYKLHLLYGCRAAPSEKGYQTINDNPDIVQFSWELSTTPVPVTGHAPTASLTIDSTDFTTEDQLAKLALLEEVLFGRDATSGTGAVTALVPRLPLPDEVYTILSTGQIPA